MEAKPKWSVMKRAMDTLLSRYEGTLGRAVVSFDRDSLWIERRAVADVTRVLAHQRMIRGVTCAGLVLGVAVGGVAWLVLLPSALVASAACVKFSERRAVALATLDEAKLELSMGVRQVGFPEFMSYETLRMLQDSMKSYGVPYPHIVDRTSHADL